MTFETNFHLSRMADEARDVFSKLLDRMDKADEGLFSQMRGNSTGKILAGILVSFAWMAAFVMTTLFAVDELDNPLFALISAGASLILMLLILVEGFTKTRYYGSISRTRNRLEKLRRRLEVARTDLSADLNDCTESRKQGWDLSLMAGESVFAELEAVEQDLAAMTALKNGFLQKIRPLFYYVACVGWALVGCFILKGLLYDMLGDLSSDIVGVIFWILTAIVLIAEVFIARMAWSSTDCTVTNLTVLAVLGGPILFGVLSLAAGLIALLLGLVFSLLKIVIGAFIGLAILSGVCSGG